MIIGNINNLHEYEFLSEELKACFAYVKMHDLLGFETGSYEIDGDKLFVNIVEYKTTEKENRFWEAHRKYLDVHVMLRGEEQVDLNFVQNMKQEEFVEQDDFLPLHGVSNSHVVLRPGDFLICYPNDAHMTAIQAEAPAEIKKAIFKVLI